ncbi:MAG: HPr family phosphocarrier protein [Eubacteriales bacterium]
MIQKSINVQLANGLEARSVAMLVQVASQYESQVYIQVEEKKVNAKSIMGMMTLALNSGETLEVEADGQDEEVVVQAIEDYLSGTTA